MSKMRKLFVCILGVVTMLFGSIGIVACDQLIPNPNPTPEHTEHEWGEWSNSTATCTEAGKETRSCSGCDEVVEERDVDALGHDFGEYVSDNNGSCNVVGTLTAKCSRCDETTTKDDPTTGKGHTFDQQVVAEKYEASKATCTAAPTYYYSCTRCGEMDVEQEPFADGKALAHVYDQEKATEEYLAAKATCTAKAAYYYSCSCGKKGTETFEVGEVIDHTFGAQWEANEEKHYHVCGQCKQEIDGEEEHKWNDGAISKPAKELEEGSMLYTCTVCKYEKTEVIPATGVHTLVRVAPVEATCEEVGQIEYWRCKDCQRLYKDIDATMEVTEAELVIPAINHANKSEEILKDPTCTEPGSKKMHCPDCNAFDNAEVTEIPALGHAWGEEPESVVEATCLAGGHELFKCATCNETEKRKEVGALGHTEAEEVVLDATCTANGLKRVYCSVCTEELRTETIPMESHEHEVVQTVAATCLVDGYVVYKCKNCEDSYQITGEKSLGEHSWSDGAVTPATCTTDGSVYYECTKCDAYKTEYPDELKMWGHNFSDATCTEDSVCQNGCGVKGEAALGHSYGDKPTTNQLPTCTEDGLVVYTCLACGHEKEEIPENYKATGHNVEGAIWKESEVEVVGEKCTFITVRSTNCTVCSELVELEAENSHVAHKYTCAITTAATCTTPGINTYTCSVCGDSYTKDDVPVNEDAHKWVQTEGTNEYVCSLNSEHKKTIAVVDDTKTDISNALNSDEVKLNNASVILDDKTKEQLNNAENKDSLKLNAESILSGDDLFNELLQGTGIEGVDKIYNFTIGDGSDEGNIAKFDGKVTVRIPYDLEEGDDPEDLAICWIDGEEPVLIKATYVVIDGQGYAVFETEHFSYYTVTRLSPKQRCKVYGHVITVVSRPATCLSDGYTMEVCSRCGDRKVTSEIPALNHNWATIGLSNASCGQVGYETKECTRCQVSFTTVYEALTHKWELNVDACRAASCEKDGLEVYICKNNCGEDRVVTLQKLAHDYNSVVTAPTCTLGGSTVHTCINCGNAYESDFLPALGHNDVTEIVPATCTNQGYTKHYCGNCGETFENTDYVEPTDNHTWDREEADCEHDQLCTSCGKKGKGHLGHSYDKHNGKCKNCEKDCNHVFTYMGKVNPTCTNDGYDTWTCKKCGLDEHRDVVKSNHKYEFKEKVEATCSQKGYTLEVCKFCQSERYTDVVEKAEHNYEVVEVVAGTCLMEGYTEYKCGTCGAFKFSDYTGLGEHDWYVQTTIPVSCTQDGKQLVRCEVCEKEEWIVTDEKLGHSYDEKGFCVNCGEAEKEGSKYFYINALNSWATADSFAFTLENFSVKFDGIVIENEEAVFSNRYTLYQVDVTELMIRFEEDGNLYGAASGSFVMSRNNGRIETYGAKLVLKNNMVYITASYGMQKGYIKFSLDALLESGFGLTATSIDMIGEIIDWACEYVKPIFDDFVVANEAKLDEIIGELANMLFTMEETENGYSLKLDIEKINALNRNLATMTVNELIDHYFGEGAYQAIYNAINEVLGVKIKDVLNYVDSLGFTKDKVIAAANALTSIMGMEDFDVEEALSSFEGAEMTLAEWLNEMIASMNSGSDDNMGNGDNMGENTQPNYPVEDDKPDYDGEGSGEIVIKPSDKVEDGYTKPMSYAYAVEGESEKAEVSDKEEIYEEEEEENSGSQTEEFDILAMIEEVFEGLKSVTVYELLGAPGVEQAIKAVEENVIKYIEMFSLEFTMHKEGYMSGVYFSMNNFKVQAGRNEQVTVNFDFGVELNGEIEVTWEDIIQEVEDMTNLPELKEDLFIKDESSSNPDSSYSYVSNVEIKLDEDGNVIEYVEWNEDRNSQGETEIPYGDKTYKAKVYQVNANMTVLLQENAKVWMTQTDCGDWRMQSIVGTSVYKRAYYALAELYDMETGEYVMSLYGNMETGEIFEYLPEEWWSVEEENEYNDVDFYYNAVTGEFALQSKHNFVLDEEHSYPPASCNQDGLDLYVCEHCGVENSSYYSYGHNTYHTYQLVEGATSCEQGVQSVWICRKCGIVTSTSDEIRYEHSYSESYQLNGSSIDRVSACQACGKVQSTEKNYAELEVSSEFTVEVDESYNGYYEIYLKLNVSENGKYLFYKTNTNNGGNATLYDANHNSLAHAGESKYGIIEYELEAGKVYYIRCSGFRGSTLYARKAAEPEVHDLLTEYGVPCGGTLTVYDKGFEKEVVVDANCDFQLAQKDGEVLCYQCSVCRIFYVGMSDYTTDENCNQVYRVIHAFGMDMNAEATGYFELSYLTGRTQHNSTDKWDRLPEEIVCDENGNKLYIVETEINSRYCYNCQKTLWKDECITWLDANTHERIRYIVRRFTLDTATGELVLRSEEWTAYGYTEVNGANVPYVTERYEASYEQGEATFFLHSVYEYEEGNYCYAYITTTDSEGNVSTSEESTHEMEWRDNGWGDETQQTQIHEYACERCGFATDRTEWYYTYENGVRVQETRVEFEYNGSYLYESHRQEIGYFQVEVEGRTFNLRSYEVSSYGDKYWERYDYSYNEGDWCRVNVRYTTSDGGYDERTETNHLWEMRIYSLSKGSVTCVDGLDRTELCLACNEVFGFEEKATFGHRTSEVAYYIVSDYGSKCGGYISVYACPCGEQYYTNQNIRCHTHWEWDEETGKEWRVCYECGFAWDYTSNRTSDDNCNGVIEYTFWFDDDRKEEGFVTETYLLYTQRKYHEEESKLLPEESFERVEMENGYLVKTTVRAYEYYCTKCGASIRKEVESYKELVREVGEEQYEGIIQLYWGRQDYVPYALSETETGWRLTNDDYEEYGIYEYVQGEYVNYRLKTQDINYNESNGEVTYYSIREYFYPNAESGDYCNYQVVETFRDGSTNEYSDRNHERTVSGYVLSEGSETCLDGVDRIDKCILCGEVTWRGEHWTSYHEQSEVTRQRRLLTELGAVCDGYIETYTCACGERSFVDFGSKCEFDCVYVDGNYEGETRFDYWHHLYTCCVTDPVQCGFKYEEAYWYTRNEYCERIEHRIWRFGIQEDGTALYTVESHYNTNEISHSWKYTDTPIDTEEDGYKVTGNIHSRVCVNCQEKGYTETQKYYSLNGETIKHTYETVHYFSKQQGAGMSSRDFREYYNAKAPFVPNGGEHIDSYITLEVNENYNENGEKTYWMRAEYTYPSGFYCQWVRHYQNSYGEDWTEEGYNHNYWGMGYIVEPTCTQSGVEVDCCIWCGNRNEYEVGPYSHSYYHDYNKQLYVCNRCGLENFTGADGLIELEDYTSRTGNSENYVVGYWNRGNIEYMLAVDLVLGEHGSEELIQIYNSFVDFDATWVMDDGHSFVTINMAKVAEFAAQYKLQQCGYMVRLSFVPQNTEDELDYAITLDTHNYVKLYVRNETGCGFEVSIDKCTLCGDIKNIEELNYNCNFDGCGYEQKIGDVMHYYTRHTCWNCNYTYCRETYTEAMDGCKVTEHEIWYFNVVKNEDGTYSYSESYDKKTVETQHGVIYEFSEVEGRIVRNGVCYVCKETVETEYSEIRLDESASSVLTLVSSNKNGFLEYTWTPTEEGTYVFYSYDRTEDPYVELWSNGNYIDSNDDGNGDLNFRIEWSGEVGRTYALRFRTTSVSDWNNGSYTVGCYQA